MNNLCMGCLKGFNGRNGNGYMPCGCAANALNSLGEKKQKEILNKLCNDAVEQCEALRVKPTKSKIDNTDLSNLLQKAIEAKPDFVEPPPLIKIGDSDSKEKSSIFLLIAYPFLVFVVGAIVGLFIK